MSSGLVSFRVALGCLSHTPQTPATHSVVRGLATLASLGVVRHADSLGLP